MNNITDLMTNNITQQFEICHLDQLFKTPMDPIMIQQHSYIPFTSICIATIIGLCSMAYGILSRFYNQGYKLHFVGIRRPNNFSKSQYKLLDNINTDPTMVTVKTSLNSTNTISDLKQIIKKTYSLPNTKDILIFYLNHIVCLYQESDQLTLEDFGITNNSLLTLAVCHSNAIDKENGKYSGIQREIIPKKVEVSYSEPVHSVNQLFDMFQDEEDEQWPQTDKEDKPIPKRFLEPFIGFDIIMQQGGVLVYKMPNCGHDMNKQSLYDYAVNTFTDNNNIKLHCPHRDDSHTQCKAEWDLNAVLEVLKHEYSAENSPENSCQIEHEALMKLELLSSRNKVQQGECNVQKCPRCKTLYMKNKNESKMKLHDIKTVEDIENEFKTECVLCQPAIPQHLDIEKLRKFKSQDEIDMEKAAEINAMFGMFQDEVEEEQEEAREIETGNAINQMFGMFEDENEDSDQEIERKYDENGYAILEPTNAFCFCCGEEWYQGHICDNSFRRDLIEILQKAETKKIGKVEGVPSIRCCPKCCQLLYHIECCKHMTCKGCNTAFCHVCVKPKKDGKWQCGSSSTVCAVAPRQNNDTLPHNIVITKQKFKLFEEIEKKEIEKKENDEK